MIYLSYIINVSKNTERKSYMLSLNKIRNYIPGIILSVLIMLISQLLSRIIPVIGSATIAILSGIILGNIFFHSKS